MDLDNPEGPQILGTVALRAHVETYWIEDTEWRVITEWWNANHAPDGARPDPKQPGIVVTQKIFRSSDGCFFYPVFDPSAVPREC
jgi:hypothetical protein